MSTREISRRKQSIFFKPLGDIDVKSIINIKIVLEALIVIPKILKISQF
jgi:hypothetical protein